MPKIYAPGTYLATFMLVFPGLGPDGQNGNQMSFKVTIADAKAEATIRDYVIGLALKQTKAEGYEYRVADFRLNRI